jgi:hypothetical protein
MALGRIRQSQLEPVGRIAASARPSNSLNQRCATFARPTVSNQLLAKRKGYFAG